MTTVEYPNPKKGIQFLTKDVETDLLPIVDIKLGRRVGNTTRTVDASIQLLMTKGIVVLQSHDSAFGYEFLVKRFINNLSGRRNIIYEKDLKHGDFLPSKGNYVVILSDGITCIDSLKYPQYHYTMGKYMKKE